MSLTSKELASITSHDFPGTDLCDLTSAYLRASLPTAPFHFLLAPATLEDLVIIYPVLAYLPLLMLFLQL